jgi:hypothetical protein
LTVGLLTEAAIFTLYGFLYMKPSSTPYDETNTLKSVSFTDAGINESVSLNKEKMDNLNKNIDELNSVYTGILGVMRKK